MEPWLRGGGREAGKDGPVVDLRVYLGGHYQLCGRGSQKHRQFASECGTLQAEGPVTNFGPSGVRGLNHSSSWDHKSPPKSEAAVGLHKSFGQTPTDPGRSFVRAEA